MDRLYESLLLDHINGYDEMAFLAGPRQVGKTTVAHALSRRYSPSYYLNWDVESHQKIMLQGQQGIAEHCQLDRWHEKPTLVLLDEIHKHPGWKNDLKGLFDLYQQQWRCVVTGSAKLTIYQKGADSLMGRYLLYHMHPLSLRECLDASTVDRSALFSLPAKADKADELLALLWRFGGFPKPFLRQRESFAHPWRRTRLEQLVHEDLRQVSSIENIRAFTLLVSLLEHQIGQVMVYKNLANKIGVSLQTVQRWLDALASLYHCYQLQPWHTNLARSLIKQPKYYLWDWSQLTDEGARWENLIASHLLKNVDYWNDQGYGHFGLYYLRTKDQEEVDFVIVKDDHPWVLVEAKLSSSQPLSKSLQKYHEILGTQYAFQVVKDLPYVQRSCLEATRPTIVPASQFLALGV